MVKSEERGEGGEVKITSRPSPAPTVHSNSNSNMADQINGSVSY